MFADFRDTDIGEIDDNLVNEAQQWTLVVQFFNCYANALLYLYYH